MSQRKHLEEIESEVGRSIAVLNYDLEKLEQASLSARKAARPEEYRKTLEVLDNVLAEFDDWPVETDHMNLSDELEVDVFSTDDRINPNPSDVQKGSLPVIPPRSPTTRLSEENDNNKLLSQKIMSLSPPGTRNHPLLDTTSLIAQESNMSATDEERLQQLRSKFQRVRELLKRNVIKLLDVDPPSFLPPDPLNENFTYSCDVSELSDSSTSSRQSPTVEDIPNLLPTDVLLRPQFGITYSLEEDLPPGVKEIHRTSTPKSNISPSSSFSRDFGRLSTFSSQSELEVSSIPDKVPLTSYKSLTLPNGLDRFPFYSLEESSHWRKQKSPNNVLPKEEEDRKTQKKSSHFFRKFSRKSKSGSVLG